MYHKIYSLVSVVPTEETIRVTVPAERYEKALVEHGHIKVVAMATVQETSQSWVDEHCSRIIQPDLEIKVKKGYFIISIHLLSLFRDVSSENLVYSLTYFSRS